MASSGADSEIALAFNLIQQVKSNGASGSVAVDAVVIVKLAEEVRFYASLERPTRGEAETLVRKLNDLLFSARPMGVRR